MSLLTGEVIVNTCVFVTKVATETDFPVPGYVISKAGIASREQLRKMAHDGLLIECAVDTGTSIVVGYYTEGAVPSALRPEPVGASQSHNEGSSEVKA